MPAASGNQLLFFHTSGESPSFSLLDFITWLSALQQGEGSSVHFFDRLRKFVECLEFVIPLRRHVDRRGVDRCMTELILDNLDRNTIRNRM
jgi:hypothetical protein